MPTCFPQKLEIETYSHNVWNYKHCIRTNNCLSQWINTQLLPWPSFNGFLIVSERKHFSCVLAKRGTIYNCLCSLSAFLIDLHELFLQKKMNHCHIAENGFLNAFFLFLIFRLLNLGDQIHKSVLGDFFPRTFKVRDSCLLRKIG